MAKKKDNRQTLYVAPYVEKYAVSEAPLEYMVPCPVCEKRAFDISELPERLINVRLKCPHCNKIVQLSLAAKHTGGR